MSSDKDKEKNLKKKKKRPAERPEGEPKRRRKKPEEESEAVTEQETEQTADAEDGDKEVVKKKAVGSEKKKEPGRKRNKQAAPKKKVSPPRDEAEIARKSIKHTRTGGTPDEEQPRRRSRAASGNGGAGQKSKPKKKAPSAAAIREARQREKKKKRIKSAVAVAIVAAFAVSAYFTRNYWVPELEGVLNRPKETIVNDGEVKRGNFPLTFAEGSVSSIGNTGSYLLCLDKNQLKFYDEDGVEAGAFSHNYADPVKRESDKRVLIYDKGGSSLMVVGRSSEMFTKSLKNKLIMAELADNNNVAVVTDDDRYAGVLTVYDGNGREIFKWSSSATILSVTFDKSGDGCFVTTYSSKAGRLGSMVRYFTFDSEEAKMVSETLPVLALQAMQNDNNDFWVVGDTAFYRLDRSGQVISEYDYKSTLEDFALSRSCAALVFKGIQRRSAELMIFDSDSDSDEPDYTKRTQDGSPKRLKISGGKIVLLKDRVIDCYDEHGNLDATAECSSDYSDFVYFGDNVYFRDFREVNKIAFTT